METSNSSTSSLGEFLRSEREKRGMTVEQVVSGTKVGMKFIHALEADRYNELPAKPFVRGFVVSYCRFLGLSSQEVLGVFARYIDDQMDQRPQRVVGQSGYAFEKKEGDGGRTGLWIVMAAMLMFGGVLVAVLKPNLKRHRKSPVEKLQQVSIPTPGVQSVALTNAPVPMESPVASPTFTLTPILTPTPSPSVAQAPAPSPSPSPTSTSAIAIAEGTRKPDPMLSGKDLLKEEIRVKIVVKALQDVWVKYQVDQKNKYRLVMRQGLVLVLFAKDWVALQVSSPAGVLVSRSVGSANRLLALHGERPLSEVLLEKQGVMSDKRTLITTASGVEKGENPFEGEPAMASPPPKPQRAVPQTEGDPSSLSTP